MDRFVAHALAANLPVSLINHPPAPHAFDLLLDSDGTRQVIRQILDFLRCHLTA
jgi:acetyl esterase/lipase